MDDLQLHCVRPGLFLSSARTEQSLATLQQNGITHIMQVCSWHRLQDPATLHANKHNLL